MHHWPSPVFASVSIGSFIFLAGGFGTGSRGRFLVCVALKLGISRRGQLVLATAVCEHFLEASILLADAIGVQFLLEVAHVEPLTGLKLLERSISNNQAATEAVL